MLNSLFELAMLILQIVHVWRLSHRLLRTRFTRLVLKFNQTT